MSSNSIRNDQTPRPIDVAPQAEPIEPGQSTATRTPTTVGDEFVGTQPPVQSTTAERLKPTAAEQALQSTGPVQSTAGQGRVEAGRSQMAEVLPADRTVSDALTRHFRYTPTAEYVRIVAQMNPPLPDGRLPPHLSLPNTDHLLDQAHLSAEQREVLRADASKYELMVPAAGQSWRDLVLAQLPGATSLDEAALSLLVEMLQAANPNPLNGDLPPAVVAVPKSEGLGGWIKAVRESELYRRARPRTTTDAQRRMVSRVGGDLNRVSPAPTAGAAFVLQPNSAPRDVILQAYRQRIARQGLIGEAADREFARIAYAVLAANDLTPHQMLNPERLYLPSEEQLDAILANFAETDSTGRDGFARLEALAQQPPSQRSRNEWAQLITWGRIKSWATGTEIRLQRINTALAEGADPTTLSSIDREAALNALESYAHQLAQIEAARNPAFVGIGLFGFDISKFVAAAKVYVATHGEEQRRSGESIIDFALRTSSLSTPAELELLKEELTAAQLRLGNRDETVRNFLGTARVDSAFGSVDPARDRVTLRLEVDGQRLAPEKAIAALFPDGTVPYDLRQILLAEAAMAGDKTWITVDTGLVMVYREKEKEPSSYNQLLNIKEIHNFEYKEKHQPISRVDIETALPLDTPVENIAKHLTQTAERGGVRLDRFNAEQRAAVRKQISEFAAAIDGYRQDARTFHDKIMLTGQYLLQQLRAGRTAGGPLPSFLTPRH